MRFGRPFYKMSGSGNDFVFFDARTEAAGELEGAAAIQAMCARGTGIGADGVVFFERSAHSSFSIRYFNADGSLASLCGNASLCATRLGVELGIAQAGRDFVFETGDGVVRARLRDGNAEIDLQPARDLRSDAGLQPQAGERRIGFVRVGVPHLVILCDDVEQADVAGRGRALRFDPSLADGANANFVSRDGERWRIRTYERGVEAETLACGTGAVAAATLLAEWGLATPPVTLLTRSGRPLAVRFDRRGGDAVPSLSGEGRIVYRGELSELGP